MQVDVLEILLDAKNILLLVNVTNVMIIMRIIMGNAFQKQTILIPANFLSLKILMVNA